MVISHSRPNLLVGSRQPARSRRLTFTQMFDPLSINTTPILIYVGHQETLEMPHDRSSDGVDRDPFGDGRGFDVA